MSRTPVISSNIVSLDYNSSMMTLEVEFNNGSVYQYFDVPEAEYKELLGAESKGKYLNAIIKPNYRYVKL